MSEKPPKRALPKARHHWKARKNPSHRVPHLVYTGPDFQRMADAALNGKISIGGPRWKTSRGWGKAGPAGIT